MSSVPYIFANVSGNIPLSHLDSNFSDVKAGVDYATLAGTAIIAGTVTASAQPNITSVAPNLFSSGTITSNNFSASGNISVYGNITGGNVISIGNIIGVNLITSGNVISTGNITSSANIAGGNVISTALVQGISLSVTGNITSGNISTSGAIGVTGNLVAGNIVGVGSVGSIGNITGGNLITDGLVSLSSIVKTGSNSVGNIGSSSNYFNQVFATATTALYADLAEKYSADADYESGTVVSFGGTAEVTLSTVNTDRKIAGVVSANPSYLMNAGLESDHTVVVALQGRVPCRVVGTVNKGDMMISAGNGQAQACENPPVGAVIGKALENFDGIEGIIEIAVGRV
jgi:hypothetical protein